MQSDLENALDVMAGLKYVLDWGLTSEPAGITNDWGIAE